MLHRNGPILAVRATTQAEAAGNSVALEKTYTAEQVYNAFKRILCVCLCVSQICFLSFSLSLCFPSDSDQAHANDVVKAWYIEKRQYDFGSNSCSGICGHYTQVNPTFD